MSELSETKFCQNLGCGNRLDEAKIRHSGRKGLRFCSRKCASRWRLLTGDISRIGKLGNAAQAAYKTKHGHIPQYEKRAAAVSASNREKPRRKK